MAETQWSISTRRAYARDDDGRRPVRHVHDAERAGELARDVREAPGRVVGDARRAVERVRGQRPQNFGVRGVRDVDDRHGVALLRRRDDEVRRRVEGQLRHVRELGHGRDLADDRGLCRVRDVDDLEPVPRVVRREEQRARRVVDAVDRVRRLRAGAPLRQQARPPHRRRVDDEQVVAAPEHVGVLAQVVAAGRRHEDEVPRRVVGRVRRAVELVVLERRDDGQFVARRVPEVDLGEGPAAVRRDVGRGAAVVVREAVRVRERVVGAPAEGPRLRRRRHVDDGDHVAVQRGNDHALPRRVVDDVPRALQVRRVEHLPHVEPAERGGRGGREQARGDQEAAAAAAHGFGVAFSSFFEAMLAFRQVVLASRKPRLRVWWLRQRISKRCSYVCARSVRIEKFSTLRTRTYALIAAWRLLKIDKNPSSSSSLRSCLPDG